MDQIYLDHSATTPTDPAVWEAMRPFLTEGYGNPASAHRTGARARKALEDAREQTAALLGADPDEVVFTSGATESNNLAVFGLTGEPPGRAITSRVEHPSVAEPVRQLERTGFAMDPLPVNSAGVIDASALSALVRPETRLVTAQLVNHETGAVQPVAELVRQLEGRAAFHCDAAHAVGKIPVHFHDLGVSTLALSAHKLHGPAGVGALLVRRHVRLRPLHWGGHQQQGRRPGTEPVALAVGLATALRLWHDQAAERTRKVTRLRRLFLGELREAAGPVVVNGPPEEDGERSVPHTLNVSFPGCRADVLLIRLDLAGVACSTGSACSSGSLLSSPVLRAMGVPEEVLRSAIRFSFSAALGEDEVRDAARRVAAAVTRLRRADP
jgi:cysteine desulfurase